MQRWNPFPLAPSTRGTQADPAWEEWVPLFLSPRTAGPYELQSYDEYPLRLLVFYLASLTPSALLRDLVRAWYDLLKEQELLEVKASALPNTDTSPTVERIAEQAAAAFSFAPSIESIHIYQRGWGFECWIVADNSTEEERFAIYDAQWEFVEQRLDLVIKFELIERDGQPLAELVTLDDADTSLILRERENA